MGRGCSCGQGLETADAMLGCAARDRRNRTQSVGTEEERESLHPLLSGSPSVASSPSSGSSALALEAVQTVNTKGKAQ